MIKKKNVDYGCMKIRCKDNNLIPFLYKKKVILNYQLMFLKENELNEEWVTKKA